MTAVAILPDPPPRRQIWSLGGGKGGIGNIHFKSSVNRAPRQQLLRVPGLGVQSVNKLLAARRVRSVRVADLAALHVSVATVLPFVVLPDHRPACGAQVRGEMHRASHRAAAAPSLTPSPSLSLSPSLSRGSAQAPLDFGWA